MTDGSTQPVPPGRWPIERRWLLSRRGNEPQTVATPELKDIPTLALLGPAGSGKTTEAKRLAQLERADGRLVRECRLADYSGTADELRHELDRLTDGANATTSIYLDALDEAMVPLRRAWRVIASWIDERLVPIGASVRITCRSAVWPAGLASEFADAEDGAARSGTALLQPLDTEDVIAAATSAGLDGAAFMEQVRRFRADALASNPLTLELLIRLSRSGDLPTTLGELFDRGMRELAEDRYDRFELETDLRLSPEAILAAAERLACAVVLTGRETIDLSNGPPPGYLALQELEALIEDGSLALDRATLAVIGASGLCDSDAPATFRFAHRQIAECLAGRRLARMLPHQARGLLANSAGAAAGVAGPLRETAAFAAMRSARIAEWIAATDPEVVGLSDVTDDELRRTAALGLLDRCRRGELTDAQVGRGEMVLDGLRYEGAEADLRPVLRERGPGCEDVLECAIELSETWKLSSMSDDLADLMLDHTAALQARKSAGHALVKTGTDGAKARTKPLIMGGADDPLAELKGLALQCAWPQHLSTSELLAALTVRPRSNFHGAYDSFLGALERSGFDAEGAVIEGLRWARSLLGVTRSTDSLHRIAVRVVRRALTRLDELGVVDELVENLARCASEHIDSPLGDPHGWHDVGDQDPQWSLATGASQGARHRLIESLASSAISGWDLCSIALQNPQLCTLGDFPWLLERARDATRSMKERESYLYIALRMPWESDAVCFEAWLAARETDPVGRVLNYPISVDLASDEAKKMREQWVRTQDRSVPRAPTLLDPPPHERVLRILELAETKDSRFFFNLCREVTLEPASTHYGFERDLMRTPGWQGANPPTRERIVGAAKRVLETEVDVPEEYQRDAAASGRSFCMAAALLVARRDPQWFRSRRADWWRRWCPYFAREVRRCLPDQGDQHVVELLHQAIPRELGAQITRLATNDVNGSSDALDQVLRLVMGRSDSTLDSHLVQLLEEGRMQPDRTALVARFVLRRAPSVAVPALSRLLDPSEPDSDGAIGVQVATAMLSVQPRRCWDEVMDYITKCAALGRRVLAGFAHRTSSPWRDQDSPGPLTQLDAAQLGQLIASLLQHFPPESDPEHEGAYEFGPEEAARRLRDQLISALGDREDQGAVDALRELERRFGGKYPWLRRPRARAERARRLSQWLPLPLDVIGEVFRSANGRLVRSEDDVLEGIRLAIEGYERRLRQEGADTVEDLWNTPAGPPPSPKAEEHVSSKICGAIRSYFEDLAIAADREVEIHRRAVPRDAGGEPGSELDVLVQVPARGTIRGSQIRIPIEVKLSHNPEVKTAMKAQLADRYTPQLGAMHGVYVVAWMNAPAGSGLASAHRPKWASIEEARADLERQAAELAKSQEVTVVPIVIDASLR